MSDGFGARFSGAPESEIDPMQICESAKLFDTSERGVMVDARLIQRTRPARTNRRWSGGSDVLCPVIWSAAH